MEKTSSYHEHLLHWLWQNRYLSNKNLFTSKGDRVIIHHPGYHNKTDGPDFTNARVTIGKLKWLGDVEIHWNAEDWLKHRHGDDPKYNQVILHVVFSPTAASEVHRHDQTSIPTLSIQPCLTEPLQYFFHHYLQPNVLPCTGNLAKIPIKVIQKQFDEAHRLYFEQKVNDLLQFYNASLPISKAWNRALAIALFDCLGISHNREPMAELARKLLEEDIMDCEIENFITYSLRTAAIEPKKPEADFNWTRKGSRPANHPKNRIRQGCYMIYFIYRQEFNWWLKTEIKEAFSQMLQHVNSTPGIGKQQSEVLLGTVWIPAFYLLGELTGTKRLTSGAVDEWNKHRSSLPDSIKKIFLQSGMPPETFQNKLGAVHQHRTFCSPKKCQECKIFQHIIP
jgi:hypothetical protein